MKPLNKQAYFKQAYKEDPSVFGKYLKKKVMKEIKEGLQAEWEEQLEEEGKKMPTKARQQTLIMNAAYKYMTTHHDDALQAMKRAHNETLERAATVLVEAEESGAEESGSEESGSEESGAEESE